MNIMGTISLAKDSEVIFYLDSYKNKRYANIRKFIKSDKYTGPTKQGIKISQQGINAIYEVLNKLPEKIVCPGESILCNIPINRGVTLSVRIVMFKERLGLDLREYYNTEKYKGPSKKGVRIPIGHLRDVLSYCKNMADKFGEAIGNNNAQPQEENIITKTNNCETSKIEGVSDEYSKYF